MRLVLPVMLCLARVGTAGDAQGPQTVTALSAGDEVERATVTGQVDRYFLVLAEGAFVHAVVDQRDTTDIVESIEDPDGKTVATMESPSSTVSPVAFVAGAAGTYVLVVRTNAATPGSRYGLRIEAIRPPTPSDLVHVRAVRAMTDARAMHATPDGHQRGLALWRESLDGWRALGNRTLEMWTEIQIGSIHRSYLDEYKESRPPLVRGLALARELGNETAQRVALFNLGSSSLRLGEFGDAQKYFEEDLALHRAAGRVASEAYLLAALGRLHTAAGELQPALDRLHEALEIYRAHPKETAAGPNEPDRVAIARTNLGSTYLALGDYDLALAEFRKAHDASALPGSRKVPDALVAPFTSLRSRAATGIGAALLGLGDLEGARIAVSEAVEGYRGLANRVEEAQTALLLADIHREGGHLAAARDVLSSALELLQSRGDRMAEAAARCQLGEIHRRLGDPVAARTAFEQALATPPVASLAVTGCAEEGLARLALNAGDARAARPRAESAIRAAESLRTSVGSQKTRAATLASQQALYALLVEIRMRLHEAEPTAGHDAAALAVSESARARGLLELLGQGRLDVREGADAALLADERSLHHRLNARAQALEEVLADGRAERAEALRQEVTALSAELAETEARIRRASPRYAALTQPQPLSAAQIQRDVLEEGTLLLEYALGETASYLWVVSSTAVRSYRLAPRDTIEAAARVVYERLTSPGAADGGSRAARERAATDLSRLLLAPAAEVLGGQRLLIVAPGLLQYVPFGALPDPVTTEAFVPLLARHEVVTAPSASAVAAGRGETPGRGPPAREVAVLADPVYERGDPRVASRTRGAPLPAASDSSLARAIRSVRGPTDRGALTRLPFSHQEAEAIATLLPAREVLKAVGFQASRDLALSADLGRYRILHFATHGLLDAQRPELSGVILSLLDEQGRARDGFLRLHDIYNLRLSAELVVLSACQTGLGKDVRGEGLVGLTRGFMYAGAKSVVASLWQVDDESTSELMKRFYRGMLKENRRPADALRHAQLEMSRDRRWSAPFYWAGFVVQGDWR